MVVLVSVVLAWSGALACHRAARPGVTSLTSAPLVLGLVADASTPSAPEPSTNALPSQAAPLVTPGLDNTVRGDVRNTGALDYPR